MDLLKWMAAREAIARDAGQPASQWYVHMDGDSWDFLVLSPTSSEEADKRASELMKQRGLSDGFKAFLEFRQAMAWHTDRSEEHTSELQSLMRISYAVFCLKQKKKKNHNNK